MFAEFESPRFDKLVDSPLGIGMRSQLTLTCSKSTRETLEKAVKYVQS